MSTPTNLTFREWKKPGTAYELHGWRPEKFLAFVFDEKGQPQVLEFVLPAQFNDLHRAAPAFAPTPPIQVTEIRLVPPPCRAGRTEAHDLRVQVRESANERRFNFGNQYWETGWEFARLRYDAEILTLSQDDDTALTKLLEEFKDVKRREYAERKSELSELAECLRRRRPVSGRARHYAHLVSNGSETPTSDTAEVALHFLNQERIKLDMDFGQGGYRSGFLLWTLEDARRHPDIRDPYLQSRWAKENGLDLQAMADQQKQIASWAGLDDFVELHTKPLRVLFGTSFEVRAPSPTMLALAEASRLKFGASIRFRVTFENGVQAWLTNCQRRDAHPSERSEFGAAQGRILTMETINDGHGQLQARLNSVDKKADQILSGVMTLTEIAGEQALSRESWRENPLGSRESVADYLLTMDAMRIDRGVSVALVRFGFGDTRKQCADAAGVSEPTIKRALGKARETPYAKFFARNRIQKLKARGMMKKPDEAYAKLRQLAVQDPDKLRAITEQMIAKAQGEPGGDSQWDKATEDLS